MCVWETVCICVCVCILCWAAWVRRRKKKIAWVMVREIKRLGEKRRGWDCAKKGDEKRKERSSERQFWPTLFLCCLTLLAIVWSNPERLSPTPHPSPIILFSGDPDKTRRGPRLSLSCSLTLPPSLDSRTPDHVQLQTPCEMSSLYHTNMEALSGESGT